MVKEKMTKNFFSLRIFSRFRFLKHFWWNSFDLNQKVKLNLLTLLLGTSLKIVFYLWTCDLSLHNSFILIFKWKQFTSQARIIFQTRSFIFKKDTFYKIYCKYFTTKNWNSALWTAFVAFVWEWLSNYSKYKLLYPRQPWKKSWWSTF